MAIVTRDEVKTFLRIENVDQDALIDALIPQAEGLYLKIRGIDFFTFEGDLATTSTIITDIADDDFTYIKKGKVVEDLDNGFRAFVTLVEADENQITTNIAATYDGDNITLTIYPHGAQLVASKIIGYFLEKCSANGIKSESIGTYDYTKFDSMSGLPADITCLVEKYSTGWC